MSKLIPSILLLYSAFLIPCTARSQEAGKLDSLDAFFYNIPLQQGFEKWVEYLYKHPYMGLDSANYRGTFSSLKPGMKSHFPFPDSVQVKILAGNELRRIPGIEPLINHRELFIEAVFGDGLTAKKNARDCFKKLRAVFRNYYRVRNVTNYIDLAQVVAYKKGINKNFPEFSLAFDYADDLNFYYVMLIFPVEDTIAEIKK